MTIAKAEYEIGDEIGSGGMATVYAGKHKLTNRLVAVKVLHHFHERKEEIQKRFFAEALVSKTIRHPNIVDVFDIGTFGDQGDPCIVMEHLHGETLEDRLKREPALPESEVVDIALQMARGLAMAHGAGVVHRDIKPANIFLADDPTGSGGKIVKILDFGIAKIRQEIQGKAETETGQLMGTWAYMSPEQCENSKDVDAGTDIYALGVVLYQMVCRRLPFEFENFADYVVAHRSRKSPPIPSRHCAQLSPDLERIIRQAMSQGRDDRQSALCLISQLERLKPADASKGKDKTIVKKGSFVEFVVRRIVRERLVGMSKGAVGALAIGAALVGAAVTAGFFLNRDSDFRAKNSSAADVQDAVSSAPNPNSGNSDSDFPHDAGQAVSAGHALNVDASVDIRPKLLEVTLPGPIARFEVSPDKLTVIDRETGLMWQRDGSGERSRCDKITRCTWPEAKAYCTSLTLGGQSGWRLPTEPELRGILDPKRQPAIDLKTFPDTPNESFWTSSRDENDWGMLCVHLYTSHTYYADGDYYRRRVRCVR